MSGEQLDCCLEVLRCAVLPGALIGGGTVLISGGTMFSREAEYALLQRQRSTCGGSRECEHHRIVAEDPRHEPSSKCGVEAKEISWLKNNRLPLKKIKRKDISS